MPKKESFSHTRRKEIVGWVATGLIALTTLAIVGYTIEGYQMQALLDQGYHCISRWGLEPATADIVNGALKTSQAIGLLLRHTACFPPAP